MTSLDVFKNFNTSKENADYAHSCKTCKHIIPDVSSFGYIRRTFFEWLIGKPRIPSADAYRFAYCGVNLVAASVERKYSCHGNNWEAK